MNRWSWLVAAAAGALAAAAAAGPQASPDAAPLTACVDEDNPPFSSRSPAEGGIDLEIARAIAARLGRPLQPVWVQVPRRGGLGKALRLSIDAGRCEIFMGLPHGDEMASELAEHRLVTSRAYLTVGYLLVGASQAPPPAPQRSRIGVVTATPADWYLHQQQLRRVPYASARQLLQGLREGEVELALVWSAALAAAGAGSDVRPLPAAAQPADPSLRTGLAVATRRADAATTQAIDQAVAALRDDGSFERIAQARGLPALPSTPSSSTRTPP